MTTYTWTTASSGTWSTGTWAPAGPPAGTGNAALINATGANYTVTYDQSVGTIGVLTVSSANATLAFNANDSLKATSVGLTAGAIDLLNTGAVLSTNTLTTSAATTLDVGSGAEITTVGSTNVSGLFEINNGLGTLSELDLLSGGSIDIAGATGSLHASGTLSIAAGSTAEVDSGATMSTGGKFVVAGTVEAMAGTGTLGWTSVTGPGVIEANGATLVLTNNIPASSGISFEIGNSAASVLQASGTISNGNTFSFLGAAGEFAYGGSTAPRTTISGLNAATGKTNFIDMTQTVVSVTGGGTGSGTSGTVALSDGATLTLAGITGGGSWHVNATGDGNAGTDIYLTSVACYAAGTRLLTPHGERLIECLTAGDPVVVLSGGKRAEHVVRWVGRRRIDITSHPSPDTVAPIRIRRGAIADNIPHSDLLVSPDHAILIDGMLICARQLVNGMTIRQDIHLPSVEYLHVELDTHAILLAEGLPAESYLDTGNRGIFSNVDEPRLLYPDLTCEEDLPAREAGSCEPFVSNPPRVRPIWQRLADRAATLGEKAPPRATTQLSELCIVGRRQTVRPLCLQNGLHVFLLPRDADEVYLVSRAGSPAAAQPWLDDRRRLGGLRGADHAAPGGRGA